jgi:hypothetical protein
VPSGAFAAGASEAASVSGVTSRAVTAAADTSSSVSAGAGVIHAGAGSSAEAPPRTAAARPRAKARKTRNGAGGNCAEEPSGADTSGVEAPRGAGAWADAAIQAATTEKLHTCEEGSAALTAAANHHTMPQRCELPAHALGRADGLSAALAPTADASSGGVQSHAECDVAVGSLGGSSRTIGEADSTRSAFTGAANVNTCETGVESEAEANGCEQGDAGIAAAGAGASTLAPKTAECGIAAASNETAALLLAALRDEATTAAAARRHLATLSELAQAPGAAFALEGQGALTAIASVLGRHGSSFGAAWL